MEAKLDQLERMDCWDVVDQKPNMNIISSVWAFRKKRHPDGSVRKYKDRFCCQGFEQIEGVDYFETYSPVVGWATVNRPLLTLSVHLNLHTVQVNYTNPFVHATLNEVVYCEMHQGFRQPNKVLRLKQSLYGLKQSPLNFFKPLKQALQNTGLQQSKNNHCLFIIGNDVICVC
jgi:hypothetical protein